MSVEPLSPPHHSTNDRAHAHPLPARTAAAADTEEIQYLTQLLAKAAFDVEIRGLAASSDAPAYEMYHPKLRKSDTTQQAVSHLDTISCWRGLSYVQALELTLWERLFRYCLVARIEERLQHSIVTQLSKRKDCIDETTLLLHLIQSFPKDSPCLLDVSLSCLFHDMTAAFCEDHHSQINARNFPWSFGSGDLPSFVFNFLSTQDCFQNTPAGPGVVVNCSIDWCSFPLVSVTANVAWYPPGIEFQYVPTEIRPRAHYVIAPYHQRITEDSRRQEYKRYPVFIEHTVRKSVSRVQWDHRAGLFRAQAPDKVGTNDTDTFETILQAKIITRFPGSVRFESTSRYAVKVNLIDTVELDTTTASSQSRDSLPVASGAFSQKRTYSSEHSDCQHVPVFPDSLNELMAHGMPTFSSEQHHGRDFAKLTERSAPMRSAHYPDSEVSGKSTKKRSNSLCESKAPSPEGNYSHNPHSFSLNTELKRRKLDQTDLTGMGGVFSSRLDRAMETQCPTPPSTPPTSSSNSSKPRVPLTGSDDMRASPAHYARTDSKFPRQLSQETIQHNYREFENMALLKLIDQPSLGDVSFEKIFLGDSEAEDWHSSDVEGLSDEVNAMEAEL